MKTKMLLIAGLLAASVSSQGCMVSLGISAHSTKLDAPEINLSTGLGIIHVQHGVAFCQHISGLSVVEQGLGLNHCGVLIKFDQL